MAAAIIYIEGNSSLLHQIKLFKTLQALKIKKTFLNINYVAYGIPLYKGNIKEKQLKKCIDFIKKDNITKVLLADSVPNDIYHILSTEFEVIQGNKIINCMISDILKVCAAKREINLEDSTVVLLTDNPDHAKEIILHIYKYVKKIEIKTKEQNRFSLLNEFFIQEYGLFIEINKEIEKEDSIYLNLDEKDNKKVDFDFSCNSFCKNKVYFKIKKGEKEIKPFVKLHQAAVEFLMLKNNLQLESAQISRFCKEHRLRIMKIENKH